MSPNPFSSGNSFYSGTPEGEPIEPIVEESKPEQASTGNPPYARQAMDGSFDPLPQQTENPSFQPGQVEPVAPSMISLPLIAVGLFALWVIFKGDRS